MEFYQKDWLWHRVVYNKLSRDKSTRGSIQCELHPLWGEGDKRRGYQRCAGRSIERDAGNSDSDGLLYEGDSERLREARVGDHSERVRSCTHFWRVHWESREQWYRQARMSRWRSARILFTKWLGKHNSCLPILWAMKQCQTRRMFVIFLFKADANKTAIVCNLCGKFGTFSFSSCTRAMAKYLVWLWIAHWSLNGG